MSTLTDRLQEVMTHMGWEHQDLMRASRQSSSVVSQWLGKTNKPIKTIGKLEAAIHLERATGYSALWLAKGLGPKHVHAAPTGGRSPLIAADVGPGMYSPSEVLEQMRQLLLKVPRPMRGAFADVLAGWAASGGTDDRAPALLALLTAPDKQQRAA